MTYDANKRYKVPVLAIKKQLIKSLNLLETHTKIVNVEGSIQDKTKCTDLELYYYLNKIKNIGLRTRPYSKNNGFCQYRDFTIRYMVDGGYKCEVDKIADSQIDLYLYCWEKPNNQWDLLIIKFTEPLRDLIRKYRSDGTFKERSVNNFDGTWFTRLKLEELPKCSVLFYNKIER